MKNLFFTLLFFLAFLLNGCSTTSEKPVLEASTIETMWQPQTATFSSIAETINGCALTPEGGSVPVQLTICVENVLEGDAAYQQLLSQGCQIPIPRDGSEYILITVNVTYDDGELEKLDFVENYPTSWAAARVAFHLPPNAYSNAENMTSFLENSIWNHTIAKGSSISGEIAFLQDIGNTQPLYFEGYNQTITFQIH